MDTNLMNTNTETLNRISGYNKFGSKLGLERMAELMKRLNNPQDRLKVIHVAGTNGKGSVSTMVSQILMEGGYSVGLFTSPFIEEWGERIQLNGENITDQELSGFGTLVLDTADQMVAEGFDSPTEFEIVTAIGLCYFASKDVDFTILEVGLGGRGDSTNIVKAPMLSIITSISLDHMDRLGTTIEEIALEKAGIIKDGVTVVMNVDKTEAKRVIAKEAYRHKSPLYDLSQSIITNIRMTPEEMSFDTIIKGKDYRNVIMSMVGEHQCNNAVTAIGAIEILRKNGIITLEDEALAEGLKKARLPGRFEVFKKKDGRGYIVFDGAHNEEGVEASLQTLSDIFYDQKVLVFTGMLKDKDTDRIIYFLEKMGEDFIASPVDNPRTLSQDELKEKLQAYGKNVKTGNNSRESLEILDEVIAKYDVLMCVGSLYLIGEIRRIIKDEYAK